MEPPALPSRNGGSKRHSKNISYSRTNLARRSTKGPLDASGPLGTDPLQTTTNDPLTVQTSTVATEPSVHNSSKTTSPTAASLKAHLSKDLSFLLHPSIYHNLPPPLHERHESPPTQAETIDSLPSLLSSHDYRAAAELCASRLSRDPPPSQQETFRLFYTRLATLIILNYTALAAQECKSLEDIGSPFYRASPDTNIALPVDENGGAAGSILPWELQVIWARLTGIIHGDVRKSISAYYELAKNARRAYEACNKEGQNRVVWRQRLRELGLGVGSVLVEAGDLEGAARHLESLRSGRRGLVDHTDSAEALMASRTALVYLALGDIDAATRSIETYASSSPSSIALIPALISVAEGHYTDAIDRLRALLSKPQTPQSQSQSTETSTGTMSHNGSDTAIITLNLAICLFYTGRVEETVALLQGLVQQQQREERSDEQSDDRSDEKAQEDREDGRSRSFHALTFNLATCFELTGESEKAGIRKAELADHVISRMREEGNWAERSGGVDFKL